MVWAYSEHDWHLGKWAKWPLQALLALAFFRLPSLSSVPSPSSGERALQCVFSDSKHWPWQAWGLCSLAPVSPPQQGALFSQFWSLKPTRKQTKLKAWQTGWALQSVSAALHLGLAKVFSAPSAEYLMCSCLKKQICRISSRWMVSLADCWFCLAPF